VQLVGSDAAAAVVGDASANCGKVGITSGTGVNGAKDVGLGTGVGGKGVLVGIAAWVAATIVQAAATAVP